MRVGVLEEGFTVEPWPTIKSAAFIPIPISEENVQRPTFNVQRRIRKSADAVG
jgi:hypothetical protein